MISENTKSRNLAEKWEFILRILLALVFLSAGIFRIFNPAAAIFELSHLHLPIFLAGLLIIFEIGAGLGLLLNKYVKQIYWLLIIFLILILIWALIVAGGELIKSAGELFVFNLTPTDFLLHLFFLLITITLLLKKK
jgi:uncharacterized membrane protein YphA (DoxX/SURF4 family)